MKRKLIFLDIDGTITVPFDPPSPLVIQAIRQARAKGHLVFICTGRNIPIIKDEILDIGFDGIIASAGSHITAGDQVLFDSLMPEALVQECLDVFHGFGVYCRIETADGIYTDSRMGDLLRSVSPDPKNSELIRMQREMELGLAAKKYEDYPRLGAYKLCFTAVNMEDVYRAEEILGDRFDFVVHPFGNGGCINGEIIRKNIDKGMGIRMICQHFGAELEDTIAFGDSMNDAAMLRCAGVGIAMGNACDELKALADAVCEDVEHDGIYQELKRRGICG